jgi:AcrR family transcriptional regulator
MSKLGRPAVMSADDRRKEVFIVAERLFGEKGFEHVTMAEIATEVGMSKKTLYVHFADKRELLKSLVASSYIWSEDAFNEANLDPIVALKSRLHIVAEHVLSERHIKLCRLAIAERVGINGLSDTFYEMGIATSRNHLIEAIEKIDRKHFVLALEAEVLADMLFGATIAKPFIDLLFINKTINIQLIFAQIDVVIDSIFND